MSRYLLTLDDNKLSNYSQYDAIEALTKCCQVSGVFSTEVTK